MIRARTFIIEMNRVGKLVIGMGISVALFVLLYFFSQPVVIVGYTLSTFVQGVVVAALQIAGWVIMYIRDDPLRGTQCEDEGEVGDDLSAIPVPTNDGMEAAIRLTQEQHGKGTYDLVTAEESLDDPEQTSLNALYEIAESWGIRITRYRKRKVKRSGDRAWVVQEIIKAMQVHNDTVALEASGERIEEARDSAYLVTLKGELLNPDLIKLYTLCDMAERLDVVIPATRMLALHDGDRIWTVDQIILAMSQMDEPIGTLQMPYDFGRAEDDVESEEGLPEEAEEPPEFVMIQGKPYRVSEIQATVKATGDGQPIMDLPDEEVSKRLPKQLGDVYMALPPEMKMEIRSIYRLSSEHVEIVPLKTLEELESDKYVNARKRRRDYVNKKDKEDGDTESMDGPPPGSRRKGPLESPDDRAKKERKRVLRRKTKKKIKPRPKRRKREVSDGYG